MVLTIGHSNRPWSEFVALLRAHHVDTVADVRQFPSSRAWPQYNQDAMQRALADEHITYVHIPKLGGRRKPDGTDRNAAWEHAAFRGYADYTRTREFKEGIHELLSLKGTVAAMCAEILPWKCHRRIIADYLTAHGTPVYDVTSKTGPALHELPPFALVTNGELTYPSKQHKLMRTPPE